MSYAAIQRSDSAITNIITMFDKVNVFFYLGSKSAPFSVKDSLGSKYRFRPTSQTRTGIGIVTKWFGVRLGFVLPTTTANEKKFGRTTSLDFQSNIFAKKFGLDVYFLSYKGFYLENPKRFIPTWKSSDPYPQNRNLERSTYGANFFYIFNNGSYSQKAAFQQIEWQQYSSGSFMLGAYFNATEITGDNSLIDLSSYGVNKAPELSGIYAYTGGGSLGYSHNFIIHKQFLISISAMVGAGYLNTHYNYSSNTRPNESLAGLGGKFSSRIALAYSREQNYFGLYFISDSYEVNLSKSEDIQFLVTNVYMFYGRRFDLYKVFPKRKRLEN